MARLSLADRQHFALTCFTNNPSGSSHSHTSSNSYDETSISLLLSSNIVYLLDTFMSTFCTVIIRIIVHEMKVE